jgi:hypothetical protein
MQVDKVCQNLIFYFLFFAEDEDSNVRKDLPGFLEAQFMQLDKKFDSFQDIGISLRPKKNFDAFDGLTDQGVSFLLLKKSYLSLLSDLHLLLEKTDVRYQFFKLVLILGLVN